MKKSLERFYPALIFLFAIGLYANTISNGYNLSDELVTKNHRNTSKGFDGIAAIFSEFYYEDELGYKYDYRPITHLTFAIEHHLLGESPHISHAINVLLYGVLCLLIYFLIGKMDPIRGPTLAFFVALIFTVHPIHTEVVASIKNRDEILSLLFGVGAFLVVLRNQNRGSRWIQIIHWSLALLLFGLGMLSKSSIVPFIILLPVTIILLKKESKLFYLLTFFFLSSSIILWLALIDEIQFVGLLLMGTLIVLFLKGYLSGRILKFSENSKAFVRENILKVNAFYVGLFIYLILVILGFVTMNSSYVTLGFFLYILIFGDRIKVRKLNHLPILIIAVASAVFIVNDIVGIGVLYILLYFANIFFRPFTFILIILAALNFEFTANFILGFTFVTLIIIPYVVSDYVTIGFLKKLKRLRFILAFGLIGLLILQTDFSLLNDPDYIVANPPNTMIGVSEVGGVDRPILPAENPILESWNLKSRVALALNANSFYIGKLLKPFPLRFYYGYDQFRMYSFKDWQTIASLILLVLIMAIAFLLLFRRKYLLFLAILWLELSIIPYSNLLTPVAGIVGERLVFAASLGMAIIGALLVNFLLKNKRLKIPVIVLFLFLLLGATYSVLKRNQNWKDKLSLFAHDIPHLSRSAQANALYADACMVKATNTSDKEQFNRYTELGVKHFRAAVEIYPHFLNWWIDLGKVQKIRGEWAAADSSFQEAREMEPNYTEIYNHLVEIAVRRSDTADIIEYLNYILFFNPQQTEAMFDLSYWLYTQKEYQQVLNVNDNILDVDNSIPEAYLNKAYAYAMMGDWENFEKQLSYAKLLAPNHPDISILIAMKEDLK